MSADLKPLLLINNELLCSFTAAEAKIAALEAELELQKHLRSEDEDSFREGIEKTVAERDAAVARVAALEARIEVPAGSKYVPLFRLYESHDRLPQIEADLAAALARVAELEKAGAPMANTMFNLAQRDHWPVFERESFKAMQVAWDSASSAAGEA